MAYKENYQKQECLSFDEFEKLVIDLEKMFNDDVCKKIPNKEIYVIAGGVFSQSYFVKTTVSDVLDVCKDINVTCLFDVQFAPGQWSYEIAHVFTPSPKFFRGHLKFTPPRTLGYSCWMPCVKNNNVTNPRTEDFTAIFGGTEAILQDEKFLTAACDNAFESDDNGVDYDYIMKHAFKIITMDKRFSAQDRPLTNPQRALDISYYAQQIVSLYYEISNSWGVCYDWKDKTFIFPMEQQFFKELFKDREKVNGRRRVLPTVVKKHDRDGHSVTSHLRASDTSCIANGREYAFLVGAEDRELIFPDNDYGHRKLEELKAVASS